MSHNADHILSLAMALRDFFSASCAAELADAVPALCAGRTLGEDEARELEYEFNRLFVGPQAVPAPPFASIYLEKEPQLMGRSTLEVREFYLGLGLAVPEGGAPDDFLPYELDAWARLFTLELDEENDEARHALREARVWLVQEHMARWIPAFIERTREALPAAALPADSAPADAPSPASSPSSPASPATIMAHILKSLENWLNAANANV